MQTKAIIIGGGIGGLTAAIALQRVGIDVTVLERAEELREVGSGLPLFINALRALQKLDLAEELESIGTSVSSGTISTWKGDILADLRTDELVKRLERLVVSCTGQNSTQSFSKPLEQKKYSWELHV